MSQRWLGEFAITLSIVFAKCLKNISMYLHNSKHGWVAAVLNESNEKKKLPMPTCTGVIEYEYWIQAKLAKNKQSRKCNSISSSVCSYVGPQAVLDPLVAKIKDQEDSPSMPPWLFEASSEWTVECWQQMPQVQHKWLFQNCCHYSAWFLEWIQNQGVARAVRLTLQGRQMGPVKSYEIQPKWRGQVVQSVQLLRILDNS